jgi:hypothetical protein
MGRAARPCSVHSDIRVQIVDVRGLSPALTR